MSTLSNLIPSQTSLGAAALLPGNRFFVRAVALEGEGVTGQVALALEALSPFPTEQMLVGHVVSEDGKQALAYAAHRLATSRWGSGFVAGFVTKGGDYKAWLIHKMGGVWIWQTELKTFTP